ncbi:MAG: MBL fold metallo-hydrolase [Thermoleophilia bacterium]
MKITWFGHAAFLLEASDGTRLIVDPYRSGSFDGKLAYKPIDTEADAVLATHRHEDHAAVDTIPGDPRILVEPRSADIGAVRVRGIPVYHDTDAGEARGENTILVIEDAGLRVVHLGDLGHELDSETIEEIGEVDVLLIPVGGLFTIDAATAAKIAADLDPRVVIPMHYRTSRCAFDISPVDDFLELHAEVRELGEHTVELSKDTLPEERTVLVLDYAR